jgi:all-trans-8'-apo-beta-carotenal 15,15'-oxygenase
VSLALGASSPDDRKHVLATSSLEKRKPLIQHSDSWDRRAWEQGWETVTSEDCYELQGTFPADLHGTFYQNGPAKFVVGRDRVVHPFDGDGMVRAVTFNDGTAWFRNRFVRTLGYEKELRHGRIMHRGVFGTKRRPAIKNVMDVNLKNVANTHVMFQNGRLYALWEAGCPVELNPVTLETIDPIVTKFGDRYAAHYKVDPNTGTILNFSIYTGLPDPNHHYTCKVVEHSPDGRLLFSQTHVLPGLVISHDMAITNNYYCFIHAPCTINMIPFLLGTKSPAQSVTLDTSQSAFVHLLPRRHQEGGAPISIEIPGTFCTHIANAYQDDETGDIFVDCVESDSMNMIDSEAKMDPLWETVDFERSSPSKLVRYRLDPVRRTVRSKQTFTNETGSIEFPVVHPDYVGRRYKYVYGTSGASATLNAPPQGLVKVHVETGRVVEKYLPEPNQFFSEFLVVPRPNGTAEDDAYLIGYRMNGDEPSTLCVFDAANISRGPIATARLRQRLPHSLHGCFVAGYAPAIDDSVRASFATHRMRTTTMCCTLSV